jgi:hypothetical protein
MLAVGLLDSTSELGTLHYIITCQMHVLSLS